MRIRNVILLIVIGLLAGFLMRGATAQSFSSRSDLAWQTPQNAASKSVAKATAPAVDTGHFSVERDKAADPPDTILADEKASLEWINLQLQLRLADETIARLQREQADLKKQASDKLEQLRTAAKVPADYLGELRGNQVVFTRPKPTAPDPPKPDKKEAAKQ